MERCVWARFLVGAGRWHRERELRKCRGALGRDRRIAERIRTGYDDRSDGPGISVDGGPCHGLAAVHRVECCAAVRRLPLLYRSKFFFHAIEVGEHNHGRAVDEDLHPFDVVVLFFVSRHRQVPGVRAAGRAGWKHAVSNEFFASDHFVSPGDVSRTRAVHGDRRASEADRFGNFKRGATDGPRARGERKRQAQRQSSRHTRAPQRRGQARPANSRPTHANPLAREDLEAVAMSHPGFDGDRFCRFPTFM